LGKLSVYNAGTIALKCTNKNAELVHNYMNDSLRNLIAKLVKFQIDEKETNSESEVKVQMLSNQMFLSNDKRSNSIYSLVESF
jgi:hypothetical protein